MTLVLIRRLQGYLSLLEAALREEHARPQPDSRTLEKIRGMKAAATERLVALQAPSMQAAPSR